MDDDNALAVTENDEAAISPGDLLALQRISKVLDHARQGRCSIIAACEATGVSQATYYRAYKRPGIRQALQRQVTDVAVEMVAVAAAAMPAVMGHQVAIAAGMVDGARAGESTAAARFVTQAIGLDKPAAIVRPEHWDATRFLAKFNKVVVEPDKLTFTHEGAPPDGQGASEADEAPDLPDVVEGEWEEVAP